MTRRTKQEQEIIDSYFKKLEAEKKERDNLSPMQARIRITYELVSIYGMHGSTKWDDYPFWDSYREYYISILYKTKEGLLEEELKAFSAKDNDEEIIKKCAENFAIDRGTELENLDFSINLEISGLYW